MKRTPTRQTQSQRPPRQHRSREKLERVLVAAEELLGERLFGDIAMADVAERAGVAVGTIYTRFATKDDLLPVLFERHDAAVAGRIEGFLSELARTASLRGRIEQVVGFAVEYHRKHRGLLRALTMYVRAHPENIPAAVFRQRAEQYRVVARLVVGEGRGIARADPLVATEFALGLVNSACREQILFEEVTPLRGKCRSLAAFKRQLTDSVHRDLAGRIPRVPGIQT